MRETWAEVAGYGYPEGVRPRNLLGRMLDACGALAALLRGVAVVAVIAAIYLGPAAVEAGLDHLLNNTLPPTAEGAVATKGGAR